MKTVFFRIDCSNKAGMGHLSRAKALAEQFVNSRCDLYIFGVSQLEPEWIKPFRNIFYLSSPLEFPSDQHYDLGIFDFSTASTFSVASQLKTYFEKLKRSTEKMLIIDGLGKECLLQNYPELEMDYVLIPYAGAPNLKNYLIKYFKGPSYFIFPKNLKQTKISPPSDLVKTILVTMGGADPFEMSALVAEALFHESFSHLKIKIVIGPQFSPALIEKLTLMIAGKTNVELVNGHKGLIDLITAADFCITASGLSKYEISRLQRPAIVLSHDQNAADVNKAFALLNTTEDFGLFSKYSSVQLSEILKETIFNSSKLKHMQSNCASIFSEDLFQQFISDLGV